MQRFFHLRARTECSEHVNSFIETVKILITGFEIREVGHALKAREGEMFARRPVFTQHRRQGRYTTVYKITF